MQILRSLRDPPTPFAVMGFIPLTEPAQLSFISAPLVRSGFCSRPRNAATSRRQNGRFSMAVRLGPNDENVLYCSEIAIGTIAWGDPNRGYGSDFQRRDVDSAVKYCIDNGVNLFDVAEVYGYQGMASGESAEHILGDALISSPGSSVALVADKFFPVPWTNLLVGGRFRLGRGAVIEAVRASLTRLGVGAIDLYQLHFPPFLYIGGGEDAIVDGFAEAFELGLIRRIGVSNFDDPKALKRIHAKFTKLNIPLVTNQVKFNLLERKLQQNGLLETANELGITTLAYEPLAKGLLTGKYTDNLASPGRQYTQQQLAVVKPLTDLMKFLGAMQGRGRSKSVTEVALGYIMSKGIVPIVGIKNEGQAREVVRAMDPNRELSTEFVEALDEKSDYIARLRRV